MSSLAEEYPKQQARCRELLETYNSIPTGGFGAVMIRGVLERAEKAAASGDVVAMMSSFEEMEGCK